jgi:hypothetical protein
MSERHSNISLQQKYNGLVAIQRFVCEKTSTHTVICVLRQNALDLPLCLHLLLLDKEMVNAH